MVWKNHMGGLLVTYVKIVFSIDSYTVLKNPYKCINLKILCERYLQHQQDLYRIFIDFKEAFDRVWHAALWATMRLYNINTNLFNAIQNLYDKATSAVCFNGSTGDWFRTTVDRAVCSHPPSSTYSWRESWLKHFKITNRQSALEAGQSQTYVLLMTGGLAGSELELANLVERLDKTSTAYGMQISAEKTKLMTNNTNGISSNIRVNGENLKTVQSFKYLGPIVTDEGYMPEIRSRIAQTIAGLTKLKIIWDDKNIDLSSKIRLLCSLVMSIFLYSRETWTLTAEIERKIQTVEMRSFRHLLGILFKDHITNEEVRSRIRKAIGPYEELMSTVKRHKMKWYGHVTRASGLAKTVPQGTVRGERGRGRQRKWWEDNIRDWTGLELSDAVRRAEEQEEWRMLVARSFGAPMVPKTMG